MESNTSILNTYGRLPISFEKGLSINDFIDLANKKGTTKEQLEKAFNEIPSADIRYFSDFGYVNPNFINTFSKDGSSRTKAQQYNVEVDNKWKNNPYVITQQGKIIEAQILTKAGILKGTEAVDGKKAKELMKVVIELAPGESRLYYFRTTPYEKNDAK